MNTATKKHDYKDLSDHRYTVQVSDSTNYGWFEHPIHGDERGGGLWFEGKTLTDYDGVYALPTDVCKILTAAGYIVEAEFWPSGIVGQ